MAEEKKRLRTTYTVLEEVKKLRKEHSAENDKSAEITALLKEAIELLPSSVTKESDLNKLHSTLNNCKKILSNEQKQEIGNALTPQKDKEEHITALSDRETANNLAAVLGGVQAYIAKREAENKNHFDELLGKDPNDLTTDEISFLRAFSRDGLTESDSNRLNSILEARSEPEQAEPETAPAVAPEQAEPEAQPEPEVTPVAEPEQAEQETVAPEPTPEAEPVADADPAIEPEQAEPEATADDIITPEPIVSEDEDSLAPTAEEELDAEIAPEPIVSEDEDSLAPTAEEELEDEIGLEPINIGATAEDEEIEKYMNEIRHSEKDVSSYLSDFIQIKSAGIEAAMDVGVSYVGEGEGAHKLVSPKDRAIAFGSANNILTAYEYYAKDADKLNELDDVAIAFLSADENQELLTTDTANNAYAILALADRIKAKDESLYNQVTSTLTSSLKAYDAEKFGNKSEEELAANYQALEEALKELPASEMMKVLNQYSFTDDKGNPLVGKKREAAQKDVLDLARAMAAEQLVQIGVPNDKTLLNQFVKEQIESIMNKGVDERIIDAVDKIFEQQIAEYKHTQGIMTQLLEDKDGATLAAAARALAEKDWTSLPSATDEDKERLINEYTEKLENGDNDTTQQAAIVLTDKERPIVPKNKLQEQLQEGSLEAMTIAAAMLARKETGFFPEDVLTTTDKIALEKAKDKHFKDLTDAQKTQKTFSHSELTGRLAGGMAHAETFKKRIGQHFGENKLFNGVSSWLQKIDKKLTKKYGKKYTQTKKVVKTVSQFGWGMAKSFGMMTAASALGPAGMAAYMSYLAYKQGKSIVKEWKDPNKTNWEKFAALGGAAITGALTLGGLGGAIGQLAGEHAPALTQNMSNMMTQMHWGVRASIVTFAQTLPNQVKGMSLRRKIKKMEKAIKAETDPKKLNDLIKQHADLKESKKQNLVAMGAKAAGTFAAAGIMSSTFVQNLRAECLATVGMGTAVTAAAHSADDTHTPSTPAQPNALNEANPFSAEFKPTNAFGLEADANTDEATVRPPFKDAAAQAEAEKMTAYAHTAHDAAAESPADSTTVANEAENTNGKPDELLARRAENLAAAGEKDSGHLGKSDLDSIQKDMDSYHGGLLNLSADEKAALMKSLAEGYGTNSYEAMHAAMAEPEILAEQMGITADVEASAQKAEIDINTQYSKAVLNHLATHPELADNEGFKAYVAEHFDEQDRFHSSNYTVHTETRTTVQQTQQPAPTQQPEVAPRETKITFTPVDHLPGEQPTTKPAPQDIHVGEQRPVVVEQQQVYQPAPVHAPTNRGLIYDPMLSEGLDHSKYQGAYLDPNRMINGKPAVVYMPNDPLHDRPHITNMDDAVKAHDYAGGDTLGLYRSSTGVDINNPENNSYYGYGYGSRVCYGTGVIGHTTVSTQEISFGKALGQEIAVRVSDIALRQGEHALHHVIENALGRGRG